MKSTWPNITFADVGGMEEAKSQIRKIVENQLHPERFGSTEWFETESCCRTTGEWQDILAEATAGEFKINCRYIKGSELLSMWVGLEHLQNTLLTQ
jgi:SpoVK/Ycf46/Vps4 family AAA+-type ATPase